MFSRQRKEVFLTINVILPSINLLLGKKFDVSILITIPKGD